VTGDIRMPCLTLALRGPCPGTGWTRFLPAVDPTAVKSGESCESGGNVVVSSLRAFVASEPGLGVGIECSCTAAHSAEYGLIVVV